MLVLRRRAGECLLIGDNVEIEIIEISRTRVKVGVRAPKHVAVLRKESISLAVENREACGLVSQQTANSMHRLARILNRSLAQT